MFPDPSDPDYVYAESQGGDIGRINRRTHETREIQPTAGFKEKLRWNWNTPVHMSRAEMGTIYIGAQFLFRSRDHGASWERISPDLTTNDPDKQKQEESGGITVDNSAAEMHTTIYSISESPEDARTIWVGTDDGNIQLTRDGGKRWTNVAGSLPGVPAGSWVSWVEASRHDAASAFAAIDRHTFGDLAPYVFVTHDFGKSWKRIVAADQGVRGYAHVVKEDPVAADLLFLGTEMGLWISNDAGAHWAEFKGGGFPSVAVRDLVVHERDSDLVLATHGRGIWIIDDITPMRALTPELLASEAAFVPTRPQQQRLLASGGWSDGDASFVGDPAPSAAQIAYYQRSRHLFGKLRLEIFDKNGWLVETLPASKHRGLNRVSWSMRTKPPKVPPAASVAGGARQGPRVVPGVYTVRMTKGTQTYETALKIGLDRRASFTEADRKANFDASMRVHMLLGRMTDLVARLVGVRDGAAERAGKLPDGDDLRSRLGALSESAEKARKEIVATKEGGAITGEERLREHMTELYGALVSYEGKPATYLLERTDALERELDEVERSYKDLADKDLAVVNAQLEARKLAPIVPPASAPDRPASGEPARKTEPEADEDF
jgi:hypothetical protein